MCTCAFIAAGEIAHMGDHVLIPGILAEVHIRSAERTPLSYIFKQLADQFARAFREN